jgi:RNA polymerase sigma-70 factor (ECF subfamily)
MKSRERIFEELLVLKSQQGDRSAFEELIDRTQEKLWRHAWRLLGEDQAAWDVLQETWMAIAKDLRRLNDPGAFRGWAYRIASNKCRDWIRREQRRRREDREYWDRSAEDRADRIQTSRRIGTLREALEELSGKDKAILSLHYEEEFDLETISQILDIPLGTVKSRLFSAREHLKNLMEEKNDEGL